MGFSGGGEAKIGERLVTNLIMPLKVAAAFALSFVMVAAMMDFNPETGVDFIEIGGGGLSQFGVSSLYGLMWKVATVVIFWQAAFWAISGSEASFITDKIKSGGQAVGKYAATFAADQVPLPLGKGQGLTLANIGSLPRIPGEMLDRKMRTNMDEFKKANFPEAFGGRAAIEAQGRLSETMGSMKGRELNTDLATKLAQAIKKEGLGAINTRDSAQAEIFKKLEGKAGFTFAEFERADAGRRKEMLKGALGTFSPDAANIIGKAETGTGTTAENEEGENKIITAGVEGHIRYDHNVTMTNAENIVAANEAADLKVFLENAGLTKEELAKVENIKAEGGLLKSLQDDLKEKRDGRDLSAREKNKLKTQLEELVNQARAGASSDEGGGEEGVGG